MAIAFVQEANATGSSVTSIDVTLTGVGTGNLVVMNCFRAGTNRDLSTQDITNTVNGTVAVAETVITGNQREVAIDYIPSAVGGNTTYRLTASGSASVLILDVFEFSGGHASPLDATSTSNNESGTTHICAAAGAIDTVSDVAVSMALAMDGTSGGGSDPSGYTMSTLSSTAYRSGYKVSATALTDENASQTTVSSRASIGAVASFKGAAAATSAVQYYITKSQAINRSNSY